MFKRNICIFIIFISILRFAQPNEKMKFDNNSFYTLFILIEEKAEKQNSFREKVNAFALHNGFSLRDRNKFMGIGISLVTVGTSTFLSGLISMIVLFYYYNDSVTFTEEEEYDKNGILINEYVTKITKRTSYQNIAPIFGSIFMPLGGIISILSIIPFLFCASINILHNKRKKENGEKLTFFDRMNFNVGFIMVNNIFVEYENKLNLSMSISL